MQLFIRTVLICILFFFVSTNAKTGTSRSSSILISGRVLSEEDSSPLEGAVIRAKGTGSITGTMPDGAFSLELSPVDTILLIGLSGYETKEIRINKETFYEISLKRARSQIGAVDYCSLQFHFFEERDRLLLNPCNTETNASISEQVLYKAREGRTVASTPNLRNIGWAQ
jgi:hypothetical protein